MKIKDRILYKLQSYRSGISYYNKNNYYNVEVPDRIDIGLTDACNEKCFMCPNPGLPNPRGYMDEELFYKIIDESNYLKMKGVGLGLFGEPTMHKKFTHFIQYINNKGMEYYCSTNAVSLTNEMSDFLVDNSKGRLHLSLYSTSEQSFELVHGIKGKGYNKVVANIEYLFNRLIKKKNPELLIFMNYLDTEKDEGGYQVWLDKWLPLIEKVPHLKSTEKPYITWMGQVDDTEKNKRNAGFIHYNKPCEKIVDRLTVDWDGRVTACCLSWDEKTLNLGNIKSESLLDIWQGKRLRDIRDQMLRHDLSKLPGCASCEYSLGYIENKSSYFKWLFNLNGKSQ